ncbi:hypothetical protein ACJX0J_031095, partial [Zea mays]
YLCPVFSIDAKEKWGRNLHTAMTNMNIETYRDYETCSLQAIMFAIVPDQYLTLGRHVYIDKETTSCVIFLQNPKQHDMSIKNIYIWAHESRYSTYIYLYTCIFG